VAIPGCFACFPLNLSVLAAKTPALLFHTTQKHVRFLNTLASFSFTDTSCIEWDLINLTVNSCFFLMLLLPCWCFSFNLHYNLEKTFDPLCQGPSLKHSNEGCLHLFAAIVSSNCDLADIFGPAKHFGNRLMSIFEFPVPFFFLFFNNHQEYIEKAIKRIAKKKYKRYIYIYKKKLIYYSKQQEDYLRFLITP